MEKNQEILKIEELNVSVNNELIIKGLNLCIKQGEIHAIMGKNGSGKSTLAKVISGHPMYKVTKGKIFFKNKDITYEEPDSRSHMGIFLGFQYPVEVPGVSNIDFLRLAYNSKRKQINKAPIDPLTFFDLVSKKLKNINMDPVFLDRSLNEGFSGGEKKKNEILQMSLLQSELSVLDEIDSGLDVDALKDISENINKLHNSSKAILFITHYQKLIEYVKPDYVHIMDNGVIKISGNTDLATKIDTYGYEHVL
uniref:Iron-sulfur cluster formation ABC transporterATP-binding subunit n=1 Tax=Vertebrata australis TaxID=1967852 RepID=A0A1Z1MI78_9FLOR|nr:Iron-sulfur cluster formation ABC transporterATP-binding subunit [Vertebrata australis]ARW65780.1 Iron-sulfur cluster formation ABC transporterATP-binding subunit [Vertebrata australis]